MQFTTLFSFCLVILFSSKLFAAPIPNFYGGVLVTKDHARIGLVCTQIKTDVCQNFDLYLQYSEEEEFDNVGAVSLEDKKEIVHGSYRASRSYVTSDMAALYLAPSIFALAGCANSSTIACVAFPFVLSFDLAKAPFVAVIHVAYATGNFATQARFARYLKFMANKKKKGSIKEISSRNYFSLLNGFSVKPDQE